MSNGDLVHFLLSLTRPQTCMFPGDLPESGSQNVETTLAGTSQSKCFLASTGTSLRLKCLHCMFQFQQTSIPTKRAQPAPLCRSTCLRGEKMFHFFIRLPICLMARREDSHSGCHLEALLKEQSLQNKHISETRTVGEHLPLPHYTS